LTGRRLVYVVAAIWIGYSIARILLLGRAIVPNVVAAILGLVVLALLVRRRERRRP
jgi:MYXO-CTERM domain-containing protein